MKQGIHQIPAAQYHADPCETPSLSNSIAKVILKQSPLHAFMAHPRLNKDYEGDDDTKFDIGTAAHHYLLEGNSKIAVIEASDWRTNAAKELRDAALKADKIPLLAHKFATVEKMVNVAQRAIADCKDLGGITLADGRPEQTLIWQEGELWMRSRIDWLSDSINGFDNHKLILDYKTTEIAAPDSWMRAIMSNGYDMQEAFYRRGVKATSGYPAKFLFMVQETTAPYACYFVSLPPQYQAIGDEKVRTAMAIWSECLKTGNWPGYPSRIMYPELKPWMETDWIEARCQIEESRMMPISEYIEKEGIPL